MKRISSSLLCRCFFFLALLNVSGCGIQAIPQAKNSVDAAWAEVMNQYKRRADLVPNLVNIVKGYAQHEKSTFESVTLARSKATSLQIDPAQLNQETIAQFQNVQGELSQALGKLLMVAENYPQLKANENFRDLQIQLEGTENRITIARKRYIDSVMNFNNLVDVFPTSITNWLFFHYVSKPQFIAENPEAVQRAPEVQF